MNCIVLVLVLVLKLKLNNCVICLAWSFEMGFKGGAF